MHYLDIDTEKFLIWIWEKRGDRLHASGLWVRHGRTVTVFQAPFIDTVFRDVTRKHLQQLAGSKGYGGPLAKLKHQGEKRWQKVTVTLTDEGERWADSPYLRSRHSDHPSRDDVKAKAGERKVIDELRRRVEILEAEQAPWERE